MEQIDPEKTYSLAEAYRFSAFKAYSTFRRYVDRGELVSERIEGKYKVKGQDLLDFLEKQAVDKSA